MGAVDKLGDIPLDNNIDMAKWARMVRDILGDLHDQIEAAAEELRQRMATRGSNSNISAAVRAQRITKPLNDVVSSLEGLEKKPAQALKIFEQLFEEELEEARGHKKATAFKIHG